jgi:hypothetical protein
MGKAAEETPEIVGRIARFVDAPEPGGFERLALEAFEFQFRRVEPYRRLCRSVGAVPGEVGDWRRVPAVPVLAFKTLELAAAPAVELFRSSGTTGVERSVHHHPYPDLYRRVIDRSFPDFCLDRELAGDGGRPPMLSLIPTRRQLPDSSLGFMADHLLRHHGGDGSAVAFGDRGVEVAAADRWCRERRRDRRPGLVLATSFALARWLEALEERGAGHRLPAGSAVFDTGGFKGRTRELSRRELLERIERRLGVPPERVVREYGMTELTSQLYTRTLTGGDPERFVGPPWLRARILDPETLEEAPPGRPGVIAIFDLGNVGSAVHVATQDLGVADGDGIRLEGRAGDAELRGCSLTVELLESGARGML